jgi:DTW domain-containing protein YfiP
MMDKTKKGPMTAAEVARERFEVYIAEKLRNEDDLATWEFYTWLLEKAEQREADSSGYVPLEYQEDRQTAKAARLAAYAKQRDTANEAKEE